MKERTVLEGEILGDDSVSDSSSIQPITIEIDRQLEKIEEVLEKVSEEVRHWAKKGVHTRIRFKFRDRQILPDIPMAAFIAAEAATFWWGGLLRALAVNLGGRALLDVELISDAETYLARGKEHLLDGDLEEALDCFQTALSINRDLPSIHLNIGIIRKLQGNKEAALQSFHRAHKLDPEGETGRQAWVQICRAGEKK